MPICWLCNVNFNNINFLVNHLKIVHDFKNITEFKCKEFGCHRVLSTLNAFQKHIKQHKLILSIENPLNSTGSNNINTNPTNSTTNYNNTTNNIENDINNFDISDNINIDYTLDKFKELIQFNSLLLSSKWYNETGIPRNKVQELLNDVQSFFQTTLLILKKKIVNNLNSVELNNEVSEMFNEILNPFDNEKSEYKRLQKLEKIGVLVRPTPIVIGYRLNDKLDQGDVILEQTEVKVTYIPVREMLKRTLEYSNLYNLLISNIDNLIHKSDNGLISNFIQSEIWKNKLRANPNKTLIPLFLYYDEFEINNPLGSHAGNQKLGAVYLSIPCLPPEIISSLKFIFLALLFKPENKKEFGNAGVFKALISEFNYLENTGITITVNEKTYNVFFSLGLILGDNLGLHSILGFSESFMANFPCRFCNSTKQMCNNQLLENDSLLRNTENYNNSLIVNNISLTGIKEPCVWNNILSFHVTNNFVVDIMHDLLEGVCKLEIATILHNMINNFKYFTLDTLNNLIESFNYGPTDIRNRPTLITQDVLNNKTLKMSASETLCFMKYLGLIIGNLVPLNSEHWHLYILLKQILDICLMKSIRFEHSIVLKNLVHEHHELYLQLFKTNLIPKHHHMLHYPTVLQKSGPLSLLSSMRFEAKHKEFKDTAKSITSRKNAPYTLALKQQLKIANLLLNNDEISLSKIEIGKLVTLTTIKHEIYSTNLIFFKQTYFTSFDINKVQFTSFINFKGTKYSNKNMGIVIDIAEDDCFPKFGHIEAVFINSQLEPFIICKQFKTLNFDNHFQAFNVIESENNQLLCIAINDILFNKPTHCILLSNGSKFITI